MSRIYVTPNELKKYYSSWYEKYGGIEAKEEHEKDLKKIENRTSKRKTSKPTLPEKELDTMYDNWYQNYAKPKDTKRKSSNSVSLEKNLKITLDEEEKKRNTRRPTSKLLKKSLSEYPLILPTIKVTEKPELPVIPEQYNVLYFNDPVDKRMSKNKYLKTRWLN